MSKFLFLLFCLLSCNLSAQKVPQYIKNHFKHCYTGQSTGIAQKLNIGGYYQGIELGKFSQGYGRSVIRSDSSTINILFYADGTFLYGFSVIDRDARPGKNPFVEDKEQVADYLRKAAGNPRKYGFYGQQYWGIYKLSGDTILMQYLNKKGSLNDEWHAWEVKYRILDSTHIRYIGEKRPLFKRNGSVASDNQPDVTDKYLPAVFVPCDKIPPPDCWLKKEEWLWCK